MPLTKAVSNRANLHHCVEGARGAGQVRRAAEPPDDGHCRYGLKGEPQPWANVSSEVVYESYDGEGDAEAERDRRRVRPRAL